MATPRPIDIRKRKSPITLDRLLVLQRKRYQKTGDTSLRVVCTLEQQQEIYSCLQNQVRRFSDEPYEKENLRWSHMEIVARA